MSYVLQMHATLFCSLKRMYILNHKYIQLPAAVLPLLIIPFRATTTWCASTGDGYCVDPTLLPDAVNATNLTLDINLPCITASSIQWIIASLAYMANAIIVVEFLALYRYYCCMAVMCSQSIVYVSLWLFLLPLPLQDHRCLPDHHQEDSCAGHGQVLGDFCDCTAHLCWVLLSRLESRGDCEHVNWSHHIRFGGVQTADPVSSTCSASKYGCMVSLHCQCVGAPVLLPSASSTHINVIMNACMHTHVHMVYECCVVGFYNRYPWHVVFTGLRSLVEARGILDGNYFAVNDDGQYIGYQ